MDQAKSYGLTVVHHSCGSIYPIIGELFEMEADLIHPIQALARDMDAGKLKDDFGHMGAFCGGVDAQEMLVNGSPAEIRQKVRSCKQCFHLLIYLLQSLRVVLPDIPPANVEAIFIQ